MEQEKNAELHMKPEARLSRLIYAITRIRVEGDEKNACHSGENFTINIGDEDALLTPVGPHYDTIREKRKRLYRLYRLYR